jgi:hypothetical protein
MQSTVLCDAVTFVNITYCKCPHGRGNGSLLLKFSELLTFMPEQSRATRTLRKKEWGGGAGGGRVGEGWQEGWEVGGK